jgi:hypothetical protein
MLEALHLLMMAVLMIAVGVGVCWLGDRKAARRRQLLRQHAALLRAELLRRRGM